MKEYAERQFWSNVQPIFPFTVFSAASAPSYEGERICVHHFKIGLQKPMLPIFKLSVSYEGSLVLSAHFMTKRILPIKFHFDSISVNNLH